MLKNKIEGHNFMSRTTRMMIITEKSGSVAIGLLEPATQINLLIVMYNGVNNKIYINYI